jgi:alpha-L-fucosidase
VGYKRIIRFPAVTARDFRLVITASRTDPVLSEVGLYNY